MMNTRSFFASLILAAGLLGCVKDDFVRTTVAGVEYCVPKRNAVEVSGWVEYATGHLPSSGFAFKIPASDFSKSIEYTPSLTILGAPMPVHGAVDSDSRGVIDRPAPDHHWVQFARAKDARIEPHAISRTLTVFEDESRSFWVVWQVAEGKPFDATSIPADAKVLATCRKTFFGQASAKHVPESVSCQRVFAKGGLRIDYSIGADNLARLSELDVTVFQQVQAWHCRRQSAANPALNRTGRHVTSCSRALARPAG